MTFETWFCHRIPVFPMIIPVYTLLSLLQLEKLFTLHVLQKRKLTIFLRGNIDYTTRISAIVGIKHVISDEFHSIP